MHLDDLETRSGDARSADLLAKFNAQLATPLRALPDIEQLPIIRKSDLPALQAANPPFAGLATARVGQMANVFRSPGPIWDAGGRGDYWKSARALYAAGIRAGDAVLNCFSYHFTPAGKMFESGAWALGCSVFPSGVGQTDLQTETVEALKLSAYAGTPDFLQAILDKGAEDGRDLSSLTRAMVSGGALFPSMRDRYAEQGIQVMQCYGTADVGIVAFETRDPDDVLVPGMLCNEDMLVEILDPVSGDPVAPGEVGEVVVSNVNPSYPLMRFATGDLSAFILEPSPCGRTNKRIKGWMGRADAITKVKGMFIHPSQIVRACAPFEMITATQLVVTNFGGRDAMTLNVTATADVPTSAVADALRSSCKIGGDVVVVDKIDPAEGPIVDCRRYD